ncbi:ArnT family glycosyltransferase [Gordonia crocea]|uniref:Putative glycosyltransferase n=1 Tax=Gordonia crocea TaxID=589162 RepID=A0A7I9UV14_9ACTN|nr:glycosyltransferase family 39 protein [Gordonia crocea]GED96772.1 putative glycosyltransferase [Gordonia crocea]
MIEQTVRADDERATADHSENPVGENPVGENPVTRWVSLGALLVATAVANLWNLSANGWGNSFYSAAIQAGSQSWKAWFFGSSDMANSITVDKPPASLWIPALSVRAFGLNSWAILVPEALMGVASVALLYFLTRRYFGHWPAILAGLVLATTPVAALMFRFNNPEALLILLMIAAVWAACRALESGRMGWLVACGAFVGFGFLVKQMAVLLIVPGIALVYLFCGPPRLSRRVAGLVAAGVAAVVSAGWWILTVELWPASSRPYIGGSASNSVLELTLGYNGLGRINGNERGAVVPGGAGGGYLPGGPGGGHRPGGAGGGPWGQAGPWRMFEPGQGGQIAWLIPAALILAVAGLILLRRAPRTDGQRSYLLVWLSWLLVTGGVFSLMAGIFHSYYTAALAPAVAALVGAGSALLWRNRERVWVRAVAAAATVVTAGWAAVLLGRSPDFLGWLRWAVLAAGIVAALGLLVPRRRVAVAAVALALVAGLAGPVAYMAQTLGTPKSGSIISAGPGDGAGPGGRGPGGRGPGAHGRPHGPGMRGPGGPGGLLWGSKPDAAVVDKLLADSGDYTWVAATVGSNAASGYQLATNRSVLPIGGFNGTDPYPTLAQFQKLVAESKIRYFIGGGGGPGSDDDQPSAQISAWVAETFTSVTVAGITLYDLTLPK